MPTPWSEIELKAAVDAYLKMQCSGGQEVKSLVYAQLGEQFCRTPKAFEYRMQNISAVLEAMGLPWIKGLKPAKNVGSQQAAVIERLLREARKSGEEQQSTQGERYKNSAPSTPQGVGEPEVASRQYPAYQRSDEVRDWVLTQAQGICACCQKMAPFINAAGVPYLEVHHMRPLSAGGPDQPSNVVAVCPNCHRALHFAVNREDLRADLYARTPRLI